MGRACSTSGIRGMHIEYGENTEGKRPLGRPRRRWADNFRMDRRGIG
jgi:hypothetical protein